MSELHVTLTRTDDGGLKVHAEHDGRRAESVSPLPPADRFGDLLAQLRTGHPPAAAARALGETLGGMLFGGEGGGLVREVLRDFPDSVVFLSADSEVGSWPWELAFDADLGRAPVLDGAAFVRLAGAPASAPTPVAHGVLVVPESRGQAVVSALEAATRHLARKAGLDVFAADPATGPNLRRTLARGATLVHVDARIRDGRVWLDDALAAPDHLGFGSDTWLVVLGGGHAAPEQGDRLRRAGVPLVLTRQLALRPNESAAIDRELYRALAGGTSLLEAVQRVRRAVSRGGGSHAWAAVALWSAPGEPGASPAQQPFPPATVALEPEFTMPPGSVEIQPTDHAPYPDLLGPPGAAIQAPAFIHDTVRLLQASKPEDVGDRELQARTRAMRDLGGGLSAEVDGALSPDERIQRLEDRLVAAIGRPDLPLQAPLDLTLAIDGCARRTATGRAGVRQALRAALSGRVVWVDGPPGVGKGRLARSLVEDVFGYHPRIVHGETGGVIGREGWLFRVAASNWSSAEVGQGTPTTRMPLVSRLPGAGYVVRTGAWLVVLGAHRLPPGELHGMLASVGAGLVEGREGGKDHRLPLPADFRVILCGHAPSGLPGWVPVVHLDYADEAETERDRWLAAAELRLGPAEDPAATLERRRLADAVAAVVRFARVIAPVSSDVGQAALAYAIEAGGAGGLDEALCLYLAPRLGRLPERRVAMLLCWLQGDAGGVFDALLGGKDPDLGAAMALARHLDRQAPDEEARSQRFASVIARGEARGVTAIIEKWRKSGALKAPELDIPHLYERLVAQQHHLG